MPYLTLNFYHHETLRFVQAFRRSGLFSARNLLSLHHHAQYSMNIILDNVNPQANYILSATIGSTYRTNSPFTYASNAFSIQVSNPEIWHDFSVIGTQNHGDIVELCALLEYNGDKQAALNELAPEQ